MFTSPLQRQVKAADLPLERVMSNKAIPEGERLQAAGRAFEAVFLRQILESAQKTVVSSGINQESSVSAIYRDLITSQLADNISRSGQFGLARSFQSEWQRASDKAGASATPATAAKSPAAATAPTPDPEDPPAWVQAAAAKAPLKPLHHSPELKPYLHAPNLKSYIHESRAPKTH